MIKLIKDERIALISEKNEKLIKKFLDNGFELFTEKDNSDIINEEKEVKVVKKRGRIKKDAE